MTKPTPTRPGWAEITKIRDAVDGLREQPGAFSGGHRKWATVDADLNKIRMLADRLARRLR